MESMLIEQPKASSNWMRSRLLNSSNALKTALEAGLTGHTFVERDGKTVTLDDGT